MTQAPITQSLAPLAGAMETVRSTVRDLPVLALHWLHLKYPLQPLQLQLLGEGSMTTAADRPTRTFLMLRRAGANLTQSLGLALHLTGSCIYLRWILRADLAALKRQRVDLVAKTWSFGPRPLPTGEDFYYGNLAARLAARGVRMLLLCGDLSRGSDAAFASGQVSAAGTLRLPEFSLVPWWVPLTMVVRQVVAAVRLGRLAHRAEDPLLRSVCVAGSVDCLAPNTMRNGLYYWIVQTAVRRWRPRAVMTLYEGHAWEKCAWWGAKTADPSCLTVGYQHTVLRPEAYALLHPTVDLTARSLPDVVLCLGSRSRLLLEAHERLGASVLTFGGARYNSSEATGPIDPRRRTMLVAPEGRREEVEALFTFAAESARRIPDYRFILRAHPELPMAKALPLIGIDFTTLPNIEISQNGSIGDDFHRASGLLYRGSSTALHGVREGLLAIYLDRGCPVDPLGALDTWRRQCRSSDELADILRAHEQASDHDREGSWRRALAYVDDCISPVTDASIDRFVEVLVRNANLA